MTKTPLTTRSRFSASRLPIHFLQTKLDEANDKIDELNDQVGELEDDMLTATNRHHKVIELTKERDELQRRLNEEELVCQSRLNQTTELKRENARLREALQLAEAECAPHAAEARRKLHHALTAAEREIASLRSRLALSSSWESWKDDTRTVVLDIAHRAEQQKCAELRTHNANLQHALHREQTTRCGVNESLARQNADLQGSLARLTAELKRTDEELTTANNRNRHAKELLDGKPLTFPHGGSIKMQGFAAGCGGSGRKRDLGARYFWPTFQDPPFGSLRFYQGIRPSLSVDGT